jgi:hypothetical protein
VAWISADPAFPPAFPSAQMKFGLCGGRMPAIRRISGETTCGVSSCGTAFWRPPRPLRWVGTRLADVGAPHRRSRHNFQRRKNGTQKPVTPFPALPRGVCPFVRKRIDPRLAAGPAARSAGAPAAGRRDLPREAFSAAVRTHGRNSAKPLILWLLSLRQGRTARACAAKRVSGGAWRRPTTPRHGY